MLAQLGDFEGGWVLEAVAILAILIVSFTIGIRDAFRQPTAPSEFEPRDRRRGFEVLPATPQDDPPHPP